VRGQCSVAADRIHHRQWGSDVGLGQRSEILQSNFPGSEQCTLGTGETESLKTITMAGTIVGRYESLAKREQAMTAKSNNNVRLWQHS